MSFQNLNYLYSITSTTISSLTVLDENSLKTYNLSDLKIHNVIIEHEIKYLIKKSVYNWKIFKW